MDEAMRDLLIVIGVLLAVFFYWVSNGGLHNARILASQKGPITSSQIHFLDVGTTPKATIKVPAAGSGSSSGSSNGSTAGGTSTGTGSGAVITSNNPFINQRQYASIKDKSPYFRQIRIQFSGSNSTDPLSEYITLTADPTLPGRVDVSNWSLMSTTTGRGISSLGKAAVLPRSSVIGFTEDRFAIAAEEVAYIITGRSPIGVSFLLNKCIGYYAQFHTFNPALPTNCPRLRSITLPAESRQWGDACLDYIDSWPSCRTPLKEFPDNVNYQCRQYIVEQANYEKCVTQNKEKPDFFLKEWRIYLNRTSTLWKDRREAIELRDGNGKLVDWISVGK